MLTSPGFSFKETNLFDKDLKNLTSTNMCLTNKKQMYQSLAMDKRYNSSRIKYSYGYKQRKVQAKPAQAKMIQAHSILINCVGQGPN